MKGSTIKSIKGKYKQVRVMESAIKSWKYYQFGVFEGMTEYNDITYGILHLVRLREFIESIHDKVGELDKVIVERGITDSLFYYYYNDEFASGNGKSEDPVLIEKAVTAEKTILLPDFVEVKKTLLIQNDKEFIRDYVLKDEYRKRTFKDSVDLFLELQEKYVRFTTTHNAIDNVVRIDNAKSYITETLGEVFHD